MSETTHESEKRRTDSDAAVGPPGARVREDDLEPHEGLRYIAKLFKALALLLIFMLIAEMIIGLQQDGTAALGVLLIEATRLVVFAGFLWAAGDLAVMLIESNHDLRASRILLGRLNGRLQQMAGNRDEAPRLPPRDEGPRAPHHEDTLRGPRRDEVQRPPRDI